MSMLRPFMDARALEGYVTRIRSDLENNILPFWIRYAVDRERGGFVGALSDDLAVEPAPSRGALLTSRILWTYSASYRRRPDAALLKMAHHAYADLMTRFSDREHGGFLWSVDGTGRPLERRKQVYGQAFAIYALTEFHRATGEQEPLDEAISVFECLERHARDRHHGGYLEAYAQDWSPIADMRLSAVDMNEPKSQNTHLHVMEAYTNLMRVWPDARVREAQRALLDLMLTRILDSRTHHLGLFFTEAWEPRSDRYSYGHDIEASWLMWEAGEVLGDPAMLTRLRGPVVRIAEVTLAEGLDQDGAVFNEGGPAGLTNTDKEWWPQAEAVVGFINAYQVTGEERFLSAALRCWDFIEARIIDRKHGEWIRGVSRDGAVLPGHPKISFWKCPYHNGRACIEAVERLRSVIAAAPST